MSSYFGGMINGDFVINLRFSRYIVSGGWVRRFVELMI